MRQFDRKVSPDGLVPGPGRLAAAGPAASVPTTRVDLRPNRLADSVRTWHRRARDWFERRRRYYRTVAELSALDDHVLDDIGVRRADIPAVAAGLARRPRR